ncbi:unnamed protein product [Brassicogethes aeneus]|uniref:Large ribosomal subunit protein bL28m n=1 Tax=Brassicogethes aeneus TaxID=1431903 RepID=A0A9P0BEZ3_BRAAE|nr:unnamed protein product [Brassicogethes aeneus]
MASQAIKTLGLFKKPGIFDKGVGALLPEAYKKFYKEWKLTEPTAVHFIPEQGSFKRDDVTGEVHPIQNIPLPVLYPKEHNFHLWGGEGIIQGFQVRGKKKRRVPHFWVPNLRRSVVYSEVLDKHISVIVTERTINLIQEHFGFDHYLLKTPACDLKSILALGLKRKILQDLQNGCPSYVNKPDKQKEIHDRYRNYLSAYTPDEINWYGYSFAQACRMVQEDINKKEEEAIVPLKHVFRAQLIDQLKAADLEIEENSKYGEPKAGSWLNKINPFGKKHET